MSSILRVVLVCGAVLFLVYIVGAIRKSKIRIGDTIFWLVASVGTVILSVFPRIAFVLSDWMGIESPTNLIYLFFIFLLLYKIFTQTIRIADLQQKIEAMAQRMAIQEKKNMSARVEDETNT